MGVISWIILGLIAGFTASKIVNRTGSGLILDLVLGMVGAAVGGFIFSGLFGMSGVTGLNLWSIIVSVIGAAIVHSPAQAATNASPRRRWRVRHSSQGDLLATHRESGLVRRRKADSEHRNGGRCSWEKPSSLGPGGGRLVILRQPSLAELFGDHTRASSLDAQRGLKDLAM